MRNNPRMTPQRWKGAGIVFLAITVVLAIAALLSAYGSVPPIAYGTSQYQIVPAGLFGLGPGLLRGVVLGCFAGVAFFVGLTCFLWSGVVEAKQQRAELLIELTALRARVDKNAES
jgi:hypothetical protein